MNQKSMKRCYKYFQECQFTHFSSKLCNHVCKIYNPKTLHIQHNYKSHFMQPKKMLYEANFVCFSLSQLQQVEIFLLLSIQGGTTHFFQPVFSFFSRPYFLLVKTFCGWHKLPLKPLFISIPARYYLLTFGWKLQSGRQIKLLEFFFVLVLQFHEDKTPYPTLFHNVDGLV